MRFWTLHRALPAIAAACCVLALGACATSSSTASSSAPATSAPVTSVPATGTALACSESQVTVALTHTGAAAGTVGGFLTFTNRGPTTCKLTGWPHVTAITKAGQLTEVAHATSTMLGNWTYTTPMPVVTLAPGQSAYAVLQSSGVAVGGRTSCPAPYTQLKVVIPGGSTPAALSAWLPGADTYLPACLSINGTPAVKVSYIVSSSVLPS